MQSTVVTLTLALTICAIGCKPEAATPTEKTAEKKAEKKAEKQAEKQPLPSGEVRDLVTSTSVVRAVDLETRMVTVLRKDGSVLMFRAAPEIANLPQLKAGDEVTVKYYESLAYEFKKAGSATAPNSVADNTATAPVGSKPGAEEVRVTTMTATIAAIDKAAGTVTLKDPAGELTTVKARDPKNLDLVVVGDLVELKYTEAVAISVSTPTP